MMHMHVKQILYVHVLLLLEQQSLRPFLVAKDRDFNPTLMECKL